MAGLLGAYNVFVIVRGGGPSGQSGAISLGLAKGLVAHEPDVEDILRKGELQHYISGTRNSNNTQRNCSDVTRGWLSVRKPACARLVRR